MRSACVLLALLVTGCGGGAETEPTAEAPPEPIVRTLESAIYNTTGQRQWWGWPAPAQCKADSTFPEDYYTDAAPGTTFRCEVGDRRSYPYAVEVAKDGTFNASMLPSDRAALRAAEQLGMTDNIDGKGVEFYSASGATETTSPLPRVTELPALGPKRALRTRARVIDGADRDFDDLRGTDVSPLFQECYLKTLSRELTDETLYQLITIAEDQGRPEAAQALNGVAVSVTDLCGDRRYAPVLIRAAKGL